ncbi:hypothetical protein OIDMADRAFT_181671 [Oidiodendron maius Zn]|uniref:Uncharacterized protein n=1 Tax=Oidiodendron maius (strain Zn) TaxID=913774 RepID=A0A0C3H7Y5_OIDMZ|nr:hypothetical protein OIDMADRAFT_181671 [Oidiodendron maius Zn]
MHYVQLILSCAYLLRDDCIFSNILLSSDFLYRRICRTCRFGEVLAVLVIYFVTSSLGKKRKQRELGLIKIQERENAVRAVERAEMSVRRCRWDNSRKRPVGSAIKPTSCSQSHFRRCFGALRTERRYALLYYATLPPEETGGEQASAVALLRYSTVPQFVLARHPGCLLDSAIGSTAKVTLAFQEPSTGAAQFTLIQAAGTQSIKWIAPLHPRSVFDQITPSIIMTVQLGWSLISATILCLKSFVATLGSGYLGATLSANLGSYANSGGRSAFREESYVLNRIGISRQQDATVTSGQEHNHQGQRDAASIGSANRISDAF